MFLFTAHRSGSPAVLINTIPKSGTYLYARLLEQLGAINCGVHLSTHDYWDFRGVDLAEIVAAPDDFKVELAFDRTVKLVREGQFAVAHADYSPQAAKLLSAAVHIFCVRDLREVLVSHMRFMLDPRRRARPGGGWWKGRDGAGLFAAYLRGPGEAYLRTRIRPIARWRGARVDLDPSLRGHDRRSWS